MAWAILSRWHRYKLPRNTPHPLQLQTACQGTTLYRALGPPAAPASAQANPIELPLHATPPYIVACATLQLHLPCQDSVRTEYPGITWPAATWAVLQGCLPCRQPQDRIAGTLWQVSPKTSQCPVQLWPSNQRRPSTACPRTPSLHQPQLQPANQSHQAQSRWGRQ